MNQLDQAFDNYMQEVKKLDINGKRKELYDSLMNLGNTIVELAKNDGVELHYLKNREIEDLFNQNLSEDDYLEAMLVYFEMIKNMIGEYLLSK
ncbi:MAG TPA: hypothetical protein IAB68_01195 [Candidatus Aphodocola excrementigallinarum]|uniref:Uncharacterized protein n=1 Tax=Candidatus Aphodocola excrementigallinarum TaxID=2840670 RepID=A0A9D1IML8_9FIRM|nr:hypothetical protein [Candidatus Aphodocola excrementigallinarum]